MWIPDALEAILHGKGRYLNLPFMDARSYIHDGVRELFKTKDKAQSATCYHSTLPPHHCVLGV